MPLIRYNIKVAIIIPNEREREREREKRADKQLCYDVKKEGEGSNQEDPSFTNE